MKAVLISLESWDDVWRRNQHLSVELVRLGHISSLWFVEPSARGFTSTRMRAVGPGIVAVTPASPIPRTLGGLVHVGQRLHRHLIADADLLWVNDPALGVHCLTPGTPTVYDVTDDWRMAGLPPRITRRIIRAENRLARTATTIVCSDVLQQRWASRYGVQAPVVRNGIDAHAWTGVTAAVPIEPGPHVGYIGTLHEQRLDVELVIDLARRPEIGTVHLIGPDCLDAARSRSLKQTPGLRVHGAVAARDVPGWMTAMDVLISPHRVNDFTLSLDAIKAHEYSASGRPVVATPTSGFITTERSTVVPAAGFADEVIKAIRQPQAVRDQGPTPIGQSWADRAAEFWSSTAVSKKESFNA